MNNPDDDISRAPVTQAAIDALAVAFGAFFVTVGAIAVMFALFVLMFVQA